MSRSLKKKPYVEERLMQRITKMNEARVAYEKDEDIQKLMLEYNTQQIALAEEYKKDPVDENIVNAIENRLNEIVSAVTTYQAAATGTTIPTGTWSETVPKTTADKPYLWSRTITTYTSGESTTAYAVGATPEGIVIGGRNLLLNTRTHDVNGKGNYIYNCTRTEETFLGCDVFKTSVAWGAIGFNLKRVIQDNDLQVGDVLTYSIYNKTDDNVLRNLRLYTSPSSSDGTGSITIAKGYDSVCHTEWTRLVGQITITQLMIDCLESNPLQTRWQCTTDTTEGTYQYFAAPKLEIGNKATDWSPAPEDAEEKINDAQNTADNAQTTADNAQNLATDNQASISEAYSMIQQLANSLGFTVEDIEGKTVLTQTTDGWSFRMQKNITDLNDANVALNKTQSEITTNLESLNTNMTDVKEKTAYVTISQNPEENPYIELGKEGNKFKVRITNTAIDFLEDSAKLAYANNKAFYAEKMIVKNELQIGTGPGFVWKTRANGNMGLVYIKG